MLIKNKKRIEDTIVKMKKSADAKNESIYLPNELSPEMLFGKPTADMNKEKSDIITTVNRSISEHQRLIQSLNESYFSNKTEFNSKKKEINSELAKQKELKSKLEIVNVNRWWPVPEYTKSISAYFIPKASAASGTDAQPKGEKFKFGIITKKVPAGSKGRYVVKCSSATNHKEEFKFLAENTIQQDFYIPINTMEELNNYTITLKRLEKAPS